MQARIQNIIRRSQSPSSVIMLHHGKVFGVGVAVAQ